jgi:type I restriction enzyme S subunit
MEMNNHYKHTDVGMIPEDWDAVPLGSLAHSVNRGASPRPIDSPIWFEDSSLTGWVRISDVTQSGRYLLYTTQHLSSQGIRSSRFIPIGSLIMSICATVGHPIETRIPSCIHDGFVVFENPRVDQGFLYYVLKQMEPHWSSRGQTGSQMNLNTELIKGTLVAIPPTKAEQEAIAEVLTNADTLIESLEHLIAKKRLVKEGTMQALLTGKKRLPGFNGKWEVKRLGVCLSNGRLAAS